MSTLRPVAITGVAMSLASRAPDDPIEDIVFDVARAAVTDAGLAREQIGLTVSASSDMLEGRPFNFVRGLESLGAHPPIHQRHVEMDGAWGLFEAWVALRSGEFDSALVVGWGKTSEATLTAVTNTQLDPYVSAPLGLNHVITAALQAQAFLHRAGPHDLDAIARRACEAAARNPRLGAMDDVMSPEEQVAPPLRRGHLARPADGACAIVMQADAPGALIRGADHRTASGSLGHRDLSWAPEARMAFERAAALAGFDAFDVAELSATAAHEVPMLLEAFGAPGNAAVDPSGGGLGANPMMATGLVRIAEAALQATGRAGSVQVPGARRALAHASAGHALQQNLVFLLEGSGS